MPKISFEIILEDVHLTDKQVAQIDKEINEVVGRNLVGVIKKETPLGAKLKLEPGWRGKYLKQFLSPEELKKNKEYQQYQTH